MKFMELRSHSSYMDMIDIQGKGLSVCSMYSNGERGSPLGPGQPVRVVALPQIDMF